MLADEEVRGQVEAIIRDTYSRLSTPGSQFADLFVEPDLTIVGSGQGELFAGPEVACQVAASLATAGLGWDPGDIVVWEHGDVAWAQISGNVEVKNDEAVESVPYMTTAVFAKVDGAWRWKYWGGSEPQAEPRV